MGEVFAGHYELVDLVGAGSSGAVWRAWDHRQQTYVSAKVMRQHDAAALVRFVREHSESLRHPHMLLPRAWAGAEEQVLFASDLVRGGSAADLLADQGPLPDFLVAQLVEQVLSALSALHARGLVHRDIRASKLLLEPTGSERLHCWLSGFSAVAFGDPSEDLGQLGLLAAELTTGLYPDPATGPGPAPGHLPERFWGWIRRMTGHADPATPTFSTAEEAGAELQAIELLPRSWPVMQARVPDRLGQLPAGWAPDGPGAARPAASGDPLDTLDPAEKASGAVAYEEIPSLPHVVPPVVSGLSDEDVPDDGFAELAELLPTDPADADSSEAAVPEASSPSPPTSAETTADLPPVVDHLPDPQRKAPTDQPVHGSWSEPTDQPEPADMLEPEYEVEPAQLTGRAGFVPPAELDAEDEQDDAEEFQARPIRVPHPPRSMRPGEESPAAPGLGAPTNVPTNQDAPTNQNSAAEQPAPAGSAGADSPEETTGSVTTAEEVGEQQDAPMQPDAPATHRQTEMWETGEWMAGNWPALGRSAEPEPVEPTELPAPLGGEPSGEWPTGQRTTDEHAWDTLADSENRAGTVPPPEVGEASPYEGAAWPDSDRPPLDRPSPALPPLDLDETEPSRWRRVLLVLFAIVALLGAVAGTWYLVIR